MLHDIGRVVLGASLPGVYQHAVARSGEEEELLCESELQELGATHAEVGAYLLGLWGLPDSIVEAIALHHRPHESAQPTFSLLTAIHAAEAIEPEVGDGEGMASPRALDLAYLEKIGLAGQVNRWREECRNSLGQGSSQ
jgi:HD-like signal output (HDOD) protein